MSNPQIMNIYPKSFDTSGTKVSYDRIYPGIFRKSEIKPRLSTYMPSTYCNGTTLQVYRTPDAESCKKLCLDDEKCKAWTFDGRTNRCSLKVQPKTFSFNVNYISGKIIDGDNSNRI